MPCFDDELISIKTRRREEKKVINQSNRRRVS